MLRISGRARRLLDTAFVVGAVAALATVALVVANGMPVQGGLLVVATLAAIACWIAWRRGGGSRWVLGLATASTIAAVAADGPGCCRCCS